MDDIFVQKITCFRNKDTIETIGEFDLSFLKEIIYIETLDLSGPKLILRMYDPINYLRDKLRVSVGDILEVVFADMWGYDGMDVKVPFTIMTAPIIGQMVEYNCFESHLAVIKRPAKESIVFAQKPVDTIIKKLLPGMKYDIGKFPVFSDYHIPSNTRPSKMLRQLAHENAAALWICRGKVRCKTFNALSSQEPLLTLYYQGTRPADQMILKYEKLSCKTILKDACERNFHGWDMTKGLVKADGKAAKKPAEFVSQVKHLQNLLVIPEPVIDITTIGNGRIKPGIVVKLVWKTDDPTAPIDESLPPAVVVSTVAHYYSTQSYVVRVKGIKK